MEIKIDNIFFFEIHQDLVNTNLINEVLSSYQYLFWEEGWGDENEEPISQESWSSAIVFVMSFATFLYKECSLILITPNINPCRDGTIDLEFFNSDNGYEFLANFKSDYTFTYYGDNGVNEDKIKGECSIEYPQDVEYKLSEWVKNNLTYENNTKAY